MTVPAGAATAERSIPGQSLTARLVGVLRRPSATFALLLSQPSIVDVLVVTTAAAAIAGTLFLRTEVGRLALVDQWERTAVAFGQPVDEAKYKELERLSESGGSYALSAAVISGPVVTLVVALGMFVILNRRDRDRRSFRQVLAITAHAGVILALRQVVAAPLGYLRETTASATSLGVWLPILDEASPVARFLGLIDLFVVWWVVVLALGAAALFGRSARSMAVRFVGVYAGLAVALALVMALAGGE